MKVTDYSQPLTGLNRKYGRFVCTRREGLVNAKAIPQKSTTWFAQEHDSCVALWLPLT